MSGSLMNLVVILEQVKSRITVVNKATYQLWTANDSLR